MIQDFVHTLVRQINDEIERLQLSCAEGGCQSFDAYKHLTGEIQGLLRARLLTKALAEKAEEHDE